MLSYLRTSRFFTILILFFILNNVYPSDEGPWHKLGNGWKAKVLTVGKSLADKKISEVKLTTYVYLLVQLKTGTDPDDFRFTYPDLRLGPESTFVLDKRGQKFPMKGFFGRNMRDLHLGWVILRSPA